MDIFCSLLLLDIKVAKVLKSAFRSCRSIFCWVLILLELMVLLSMPCNIARNLSEMKHVGVIHRIFNFFSAPDISIAGACLIMSDFMIQHQDLNFTEFFFFYSLGERIVESFILEATGHTTLGK